ncbi:MAG TPA: hypothetical protein VHA73_05215 [Acidimicrobiales bacterium]|jgi:uncharacterized membrane protein|nr:hypothetical protein [Acidimicrobiales bacterium]
MHDVFLVAAASVACVVEMVEALTIVLAVGVTRGWRSAVIGTLAALAGLAVVVAALGPAVSLVPIDTLRLGIGALLLVFGMQWLRKAILRASGFKALHDEDAIFLAEEQAAQAAPRDMQGLDWYTFTVSFKGVFLEGLEVAFIVVTFGGAQHNVGLAAVGAGIAAVLTLCVGLLIHQPLSRVPENTLKFVVGVLLTTFGLFWSGEGAGFAWPGHDAALAGLLVYVIAVSAGLVAFLRRRHATVAAATTIDPADSLGARA